MPPAAAQDSRLQIKHRKVAITMAAGKLAADERSIGVIVTTIAAVMAAPVVRRLI